MDATEHRFLRSLHSPRTLIRRFARLLDRLRLSRALLLSHVLRGATFARRADVVAFSSETERAATTAFSREGMHEHDDRATLISARAVLFLSLVRQPHVTNDEQATINHPDWRCNPFCAHGTSADRFLGAGVASTAPSSFCPLTLVLLFLARVDGEIRRRRRLLFANGAGNSSIGCRRRAAVLSVARRRQLSNVGQRKGGATTTTTSATTKLWSTNCARWMRPSSSSYSRSVPVSRPSCCSCSRSRRRRSSQGRLALNKSRGLAAIRATIKRPDGCWI
jgi:hypothetical protein